MNKDYIINTKLLDNQIALFYLGQEGFLFKFKETYILIDPYLSDYVDQNCCSESIIWKRNYPAPIQGEDLDFIDYVLCTHTHYDHADPITLKKLAIANPNAKFIVPDFSKEMISTYGISTENIIGAKVNEIITAKNCVIKPIPSAHEQLHTDENNNFMELGFIINFDNLSLYHGGDCCIYEGLNDYIKNIDIMMVPINGRSYYKLQNDIIGNMTIEEALILAKECNADTIIPMHYDLYDINSVNPACFVDYLYTTNPTQKFHMFVPGERFIYTK